MTLVMNYAKALTYLVPDAEWAMDDNDYDSIQWFSDKIAKPTIKELETAFAEYELALANKADARASALAKLADLGLTQDEINAL